jgi:hydroxyethylthiazole kinase
MENQIIRQLKELREKTPLVHNITNFVVMNNTANALLAIGASPVMVHSVDEVQDVVALSNALVINIGTLDRKWAKAMTKAAKRANKLKLPWILDPVGAGISPLRNEILHELLLLKPTVVRGNASEIIALHNSNLSTNKGVDSTQSSNDALEAAKALNQQYGCVICVSGKIDYILSDTRIAEVHNGHPMMTKVTGLGCTSTALIGAFLGLNLNPFEEAVAGVAIMSLSGELAAQGANGPGSLQLALYDTLYQLSDEQISKHVKLKCYANT